MQYTAETIASFNLKEIVKGESYVMLSQEELEALRKAVNFGLENIEKMSKLVAANSW